MMTRALLLGVCVWGVGAGVVRAQEPPPPAYLAIVEGNATLQREGEVVAAEQNMPFVQGDRLRTLDGRVQIVFPDGTAIEVAENSEVECISPTRVRLLAGTMDHVQRAVGGSQSAAHLPPELDIYGGTLDQYGSWQYDAPYGYVWYPAVAADWRPYNYGYWSAVPSYGYTWIGADVWAWPTHHYGRWGFARNRWFWIPGRTWSTAWVSWASAPGYVSWCPLGFDGRPVFAFYGFGRSFAGWTILPRDNFGAHRYYAHRYGVDPRRIPTNAAFVARSAPPAPPTRIGRVNVNNVPSVGMAVPRRQPPVANAQPPAGNRPSPAGSSPSKIGTPLSRQAPLGDPRLSNETTTQPARTFGGQAPTVLRPGVPTHYGITPRPAQPSPAIASPTPVPTQRPDYRPATPGYRSPNEYRIQGTAPRVVPAVPSTPPARVIAPSGDRPAAPITIIRTPPAGASPAPSAAPAPGAGPGPAAAPHARPAPANSGPQGEGHARGQGRGRSR